MTFEMLNRILKENNVPKDVHFMSDSGWECGPTEMNGVYYNSKINTIVFTQDDGHGRFDWDSSSYESDEDWKVLYTPDLDYKYQKEE